MSDGAYSISVLAKIDDAKSRAAIEGSLKKIGKEVKGIDISQVTALTTSYSKLKDGTEKLYIKTATFKNELDGLTKVAFNADGTVRKYDTSMKNLGKVTTDTATSTKKVSEGMTNVSKNTADASKSVSSFTEQLGKNLGKFISWSLITTAYFASLRALKEMVDEVKTLNDSMLELSKVTNLSEKQLKAFADQARIVGDELNASAAKVVKSASDFSRMGFSPETSMNLASDAIMLTKIADGITEVSEASTAMIAILKGFNMQATDSMHILDSLNSVSNTYAINTDSLADGLRRIGGVLAQSGTTFEESIGLLTAGQESLQSIEKVSSGLSTISQRLRGIGEDGEEIDGLMPKLQDAFQRFAGINIQDVNGELRSTYDIILDLSSKWDTLNDEQQAYIGFLASGTRQAPVLNAVLSNMSNGASATALALNSAGSATQEFEKYSESLQGKLDKLGTTWSGISTDFISSNFLSNTLDFAEGVSNTIESVGMLNTVLLVTTGILGAKGMLPVGLLNLGKSLASYISVASGATAVSLSLATALSALIPVAIVGGIIGLTKVVDLLVTTQEEWNTKINEGVTALNGYLTELETYESRLGTLKDEEIAYVAALKLKIEAQKEYNNVLEQAKYEDFIESFGHQALTMQDFEENATKSSGALTSALLDYKFALQDLEDGYATTEDVAKFKMELANQYVELVKAKEVLGELPPELESYMRATVMALNATNASANAFFQLDRASYDAKGSTDELANSILYLSMLLADYSANGKLSEDMVKSLSENQEVLNSVMDMSEEQLLSLAKQWGLSAKDIADFNFQMTDVAIQESRNRIAIIQQEIDTFIKMFNSTDIASLGIAGATSPLTAWYNTIASINSEIDGLVSRKDWDFGLSKDKTKKSTKEYSDQLEKLIALRHELAMIESSQPENYDAQIAKIKEIQAELHNLNEEDKARLTSIDKGTQEYADLLGTINGRSEEWWSYQDKINSLVEDTSKIMEDVVKEYDDVSKLIIDALKDQQDAREDALKNEIEILEDSIDAVEKAEKEKTEIAEENINRRYDALKDSLESQKDLLDKAYDDFVNAEDEKDRFEKISNIQAKLQLSLTEQERYDLTEELQDLMSEDQKIKLKQSVEVEKDSIDEKLDLLDTRRESELDSLEAIERANIESARVRIEIEGRLTTVTIAEARRRLESQQNNLAEMENSTIQYAQIAEMIIKQGSDAIFTFLSSNLEDFNTYTMMMINNLKSSLSSISGIDMPSFGNLSSLNLGNMPTLGSGVYAKSVVTAPTFPSSITNNKTASNNNTTMNIEVKVAPTAGNQSSGTIFARDFMTELQTSIKTSGISTSLVNYPTRS